MTIAAANEARLLDTLREVVDTATVDKVFGTPIEQDGTIVLPVAKVGGGAGGGSGTGPALLVARAVLGHRPARSGLGGRVRAIAAKSRRLRKSRLRARMPKLPGRVTR